ADDAALGQARGEFGELRQLACGKTAADDRADRGAGDHVGGIAGIDENLQDADMGPAARRAAAERQTDAGAALSRLRTYGHVVHDGPTSAQSKGSPSDVVPQHGPDPPREFRLAVERDGIMNQASRTLRLPMAFDVNV